MSAPLPLSTPRTEHTSGMGLPMYCTVLYSGMDAGDPTARD